MLHLISHVVERLIEAVAGWARGYELIIYGLFIIAGVAILARRRRRRRTFVLVWMALMFGVARGFIWVSEHELEVVNGTGEVLPRVAMKISDLMQGYEPLIVEGLAPGATWSHTFRWFAFDGHVGVHTWFPDGRIEWGSGGDRSYRRYHGRQRLVIQPDGRIIREGS